MLTSPQTYRFSIPDRKKFEELGYEIADGNIRDFAIFLSLNFPNFNLLNLLQLIESVFTPLTNLPILRKIVFNNDLKEFTFTRKNDWITIKNALIIQRTFRIKAGEILVEHDYFVLPEEHQGKGLVKPILQESLQQYININASKIIVHAGLSGGGYVWAKYGFVATRESDMLSILNRAKIMLTEDQLKVALQVLVNYYNNVAKKSGSKAFPIKLWADMDFMEPVLMGWVNWT
jgi:hypothetical protein